MRTTAIPTSRGTAVVPESYKQPGQPTAKGERRQHDATMAAVVEVINAMRVEVGERLHDYEKVIDIRFDHVDANIGQIRDDNKDGQQAIIKAVEKIMEIQVDSIRAMVGHQDEKIRTVQECVDDNADEAAAKFAAVHAELKDHSKRLGELEKAPDKKAAGKWNTAADKVLWAFFGLLLAGASAGVLKLVELIKEAAK